MTADAPRVSAVLLTRGRLKMLKNCLESLKEATASYANLDVLVIEHETEEAKELVESHGYRYERLSDVPYEQSYSTLNNHGVAQARGDYVWLLNNDLILHPGILEAMVKVLEEKKDVGIVGAKLLFPDLKIDHIGVVFSAAGEPHHLGFERPDTGDFPPAHRDDYYDAVTFACALIRKQVWDEIGGLSKEYHFNFEDADFCLAAREKGWKCFTTVSAVATHLKGQSVAYRGTEKHSMAANFQVFKKRWLDSGRLEKLLNVMLVRPKRPPTSLKVAFVPVGRFAGIGWWRMDLPRKKLVDHDLAEVAVVYPDMPEQVIIRAIDQADVVVWQGNYSETLLRMAEGASGRNWKMVYEYDDHPVHLSPFAQVYRGLGTQEVEMKAGDGSRQWLWRDGQAGFNLELNRRNRVRHLTIMSKSDAMTTTTQPLAEYFRTLNRNVYVLPNCIDFDFYPPVYDLWERKPGPTRIGWWGGDNHFHDLQQVGPWLTDYVNSHDVRLVIIGHFYKGPFTGIDMSKVEVHDWVNVEAFPMKIATAALDIVVIPLANPGLPWMAFNNFKSDIKFLEAAAYKIPVLAQGDVRPYESVKNQENGLTFNDEYEFTNGLDALCQNPDLRRRLGQAAHDYVREHRNLDKEIHRWAEAYEQIAKGKGESILVA